MGYWGYFVVGREERPLVELGALAGAAEAMTRRASAPGGWQVWEYPSRDGDVGNMNALARETGAPALFGYVMNSECVALEAAAPESGAWTTCLARTAMAGYLGAGREGLTLEDYFLEPRDAAEHAVRWAAEAGHEVNADALVDVLTSDPDPLAENLLFRFLDRLGVVPL
ncbi:conserved hypothetical protein [Streptomyces viridochromogenes DSM 40736]|uniref:Uncharacterized protein n=1 Tax=Streptomyces viridochromogenes (strain DSM 40736 / JCM 4977 / BCRC 1201 / Tue 494) TaxID=591159 RepID=D9XB83_STRVT|nr:hypothetical protein [Streptomyces viridochromogenes]EFL34424.1 conserved hypothetical protein [Streptomyces viridochromogenes DSM 40736]